MKYGDKVSDINFNDNVIVVVCCTDNERVDGGEIRVFLNDGIDVLEEEKQVLRAILLFGGKVF